jgi:hypothetical protein
MKFDRKWIDINNNTRTIFFVIQEEFSCFKNFFELP